ncbi:alpha/beta hydrolase family protein [Streptomyces hiroshimensis]|uniref:AB hydrolase-1 domain-containing protein n=1 Tax=Streptomyces hiroshimensis TaxID=66424 RepID=A0ABQ2Y4X5_9ACTN|nr:hypothetical protein [Streptomyces hiroshimensis]GGX64085.1 hypothetical protein GCM10010324_06130 [Streptomyces hiroshimensis]
MVAVVFVHGTGVREPRFEELFQRVGDGLAQRTPGVTVIPYYWGTEHGARLAAGGASLPPEGTARGVPGAGAAEGDGGWGRDGGGGRDGGRDSAASDGETDRWELLYEDPLAELREAAASAPSGAVPRAELPPGAPHPAEAPRLLLARLASSPEVNEALLPGLRRAAGDVSRSPLLGPAARALASGGTGTGTGPGSGALEHLLARAVAATCLRSLLDADAPVIPDGEQRDRAVEALAAAMGAPPAGTDRGPGAFLLRPFARAGFRYAVRRRRALTEAAHPAAGDVLRYLAHGEAVRQGLRAVLDGLEGPVTVMGHSLGGIIAFDTLAGRAHPAVRLLVTVGSQAPFLYEIGALPSLRHPAGLPGHFPPWLNLYDRRDLLSHVGGPLFPGRVRDVAVDNRQPFPASHSAYWTNPAVYAAIAGELT